MFVHCLTVGLQDLRRSRMVLWVDDPAAVYTNETAAFFDTFAEHITIKRFDYQQVRVVVWGLQQGSALHQLCLCHNTSCCCMHMKLGFNATSAWRTRVRCREASALTSGCSNMRARTVQ